MKTDIVIIGACGHYQYALDGLATMPDSSVIGIAPGTSEESLDDLKKSLSEIGENPTEYQDYQKMLDDLAPRFAVINTVFNLQSEVAAEVLKRNIHAFIEKPLAATLADLEALEEAHRQSAGDLVAMLGLRFTPHFYTAWRELQNGAIGDVRLINVQKSYKLGTRAEFYRKRKTFGGTIPWVGIHGVDLISWFAGVPFLSVDSKHSTQDNKGHGELEVSSLCLFELERDIFASLSIDYLRPETAATHGDDRIRVVGNSGILEVTQERAYLINQGQQGLQELPLIDPGNIFQEFVKGPGGSRLLTAMESFEATRIALLARESADRGCPLSCVERFDDSL